MNGEDRAKPEEQDNRRKARTARTARMFSGTLRGEGIPPQNIVVRNLSPTGLSARSNATPPPVGTAVILALGAFDDVDATVLWVRAERFGVQFATEIDPSLYNFAGHDWTALNREYPRGTFMTSSSQFPRHGALA